MDRETVITHLQIIHTWAEFVREHDLQFFTEKHLDDIAQWSADAIDLLKEQEDLGTELTNAVELIHKKNKRIEKLLKEQEYRHILEVHNIGNVDIPEGVSEEHFHLVMNNVVEALQHTDKGESYPYEDTGR